MKRHPRLKSKYLNIKKMKKIIALLSLCTMLFGTSCGPEKDEQEDQTKFLVTSPLKKDTTITRDYVCQIRAIQHIELRALERGYLQEIFVDEGQHVKKGQLMFKIMPMIYQA